MPALPERIFLTDATRVRLIDASFLLMLACVLALLYGSHLDAPLVFDDIDFFASNYVARYGGEFAPLTLRFWSYASFAFQHVTHGHDPASFRLVNVALHLLVGAALYVFMRTTYALALPDRSGKGVVPGSDFFHCLGIWGGVALFLLHPVAVYGVAYLMGRSIVMATLFSLLMWWAHLRGLDSGEPKWFALALLFFYLALYSKEHSVMAPAVAALLTHLAARVKARRSSIVLIFVCYLVLAVTVLIAHRENIASAYEPLLGTIQHAYLVSVLTQASLFFKYVLLWWFPLTGAMSIDIHEPLAEISSVSTWLWFGGYALYLAAGLRLLLYKGRRGLIGLALLAPALLFLTEFSTVRIQENFVLYRSYLWLAPMLLVCPLLFDLVRNRRVLLPVLVAMLVLLCSLTENRLNTFTSAYRLWDEAIELAEHRKNTLFRDRQYVNRGASLLSGGNAAAALQDFDRALQWNPVQVMALLGRGHALAKLGRTEQALQSYDQALAAKPDWVEVYLARAALNAKAGKPEAAARDFGRACVQGVWVACYVEQQIRFGTNGDVTIKVAKP